MFQLRKTLFSASSHLNSAGLHLNHETCGGSGDLKVHNKLAFVCQSMTPKQSASTDTGHMTLIDKCKMNIRALFLRGGDQRLHELRESQLPENRESKEGNKEVDPGPHWLVHHASDFSKIIW